MVRFRLHQCFSISAFLFLFVFEDVNLLGYDGRAPLHLAANSFEIEEEIKLNNSIQEVIFQMGILIQMTISVLLFLLCLFCFYIQNSLLHILLCQHHIEIDIQDNQGRTPLHHAIRRNHFAIVNLLLRRGANPHVSRRFYSSVIHIKIYGKIFSC